MDGAEAERLMKCRVRVTAGDYSYDGYIASVFLKVKSGAARCVVEDDNGRLFIHSPAQLEQI